MSRGFVAAAFAVALLFTPSAFALTLLEVADAPPSTNGQAESLEPVFDYFGVGDTAGLTLVQESWSGCDFTTTACKILIPDGAEFVTAKANGFEALFEVMDGDAMVVIDSTTWDDDFSVPGAEDYAKKWPNGGGNYPALSNIKAWGISPPRSPIPEPSSALLFLAGGAVVVEAVRRKGRSSS